MFLSHKIDYAMVTVYGDDQEQSIARALGNAISDKDIRILTPKTPEILEQASQNSALIFLAIKSSDDPNLNLCRNLKENRLVVADVIAFFTSQTDMPMVQVLAKGFDAAINHQDATDPGFSRFIHNKISQGNRRLSGLVLEEEYRRVCDTLSNAPASMIVFDNDKRAVFVSDHYFRAYPRIADRLVRGISVYDAFELMAREEGLSPDDAVYEKLQRFWYNLEGSMEFTLERGTSYRLKAVKLPNRRGILVMAQNISGYRTRNSELEERLALLQKELAELKAGKKIEQ